MNTLPLSLTPILRNCAAVNDGIGKYKWVSALRQGPLYSEQSAKSLKNNEEEKNIKLVQAAQIVSKKKKKLERI